MRFGLIAFDLDGTLVDSLADLAASANALLAEQGVTPLDEAAIGRMVGDGAAMLVTRVFAAASLPQPSDALDRFLAIYNARLLQCTRPYPGIPDLLRQLSARRVPLAVLTNKPLHSTWQVLDGLDLARFFPRDRVLGGDGPFPRKPDPAALLHLAAAAGVDRQRTLLVGDSMVDAGTAASAGTGLCLARYGFGFADVAVAQLQPQPFVIDRPLDLVRFLY